MKLHKIDTGLFKLDGGAMFGVVPKLIWQKTNVPDADNLCTWAMRCLLVEDGDKLTLIDTGIGTKQPESFLRHYHLHGDDTLVKSIHKAGFSTNDITDVFLTHLHFDHVGGAVNREGEKLVPAFKNALYWTNKKHWNWAINPNAREKASFLPENLLPLQDAGVLKFTDTEDWDNRFDFLTVNGHTEAQMLPAMTYKSRKLLFMADLLPSTGHIPLPYVMGYDMFPLTTLKEKETILKEAAETGTVLFLEHDAQSECCTLKMTEKGPRLKEVFCLNDL